MKLIMLKHLWWRHDELNLEHIDQLVLPLKKFEHQDLRITATRLEKQNQNIFALTVVKLGMQSYDAMN